MLHLRKEKLKEAMETFEARNNNVKRFSEVAQDYSNLEPWA
jgi:hypothetical protein